MCLHRVRHSTLELKLCCGLTRDSCYLHLLINCHFPKTYSSQNFVLLHILWWVLFCTSRYMFLLFSFVHHALWIQNSSHRFSKAHRSHPDFLFCETPFSVGGKLPFGVQRMTEHWRVLSMNYSLPCAGYIVLHLKPKTILSCGRLVPFLLSFFIENWQFVCHQKRATASTAWSYIFLFWYWLGLLQPLACTLLLRAWMRRVNSAKRVDLYNFSWDKTILAGLKFGSLTNLNHRILATCCTFCC